MAIINLKNILTHDPDEDALTTTTAGEYVLNLGALTTFGNKANGIFADANNVSIANFGSIETSGLGAAGIYVEGADAHIVNFGSVHTISGWLEEEEFFSEGIFANGDRFYIANYGSIRVEGEFSSAMVGAGADGVIINFGNVDVGDARAVGVAAFGDRFYVANYGSVQIEGAPGDLIAFGSPAMVGVGADGVIINFGNVDIGDASGVGVAAFGDRFYVANYGSVQVSDDRTVAEPALEGRGDDGLLINFGLVNSGSGLRVLGDRSQIINAGHVTTSAVGGGVALDAVGEGASALNLGHVLVTSFLGVGIAGGFATQITNRGVISVAADFSHGMIGSAEVSNFGVIETQGLRASGMAGVGEDCDIVNAGRISTEGNLGFGIQVSQTNFGEATDAQIINRGLIDTQGDGAAGVVMFGSGHHLTNSGRITTDGSDFDHFLYGNVRAAGVFVQGDDAIIENTHSGVIKSENAGSPAVDLNSIERIFDPPDLSSHVENFGLISGTTIAILGGAGQETVINHGRIVGDVVLGNGDDTFVFGKGGTLSGNLFLGGGNDLVVVEDGSGKSRIADFVAGAASDDQIDVSAFFTNFGDLKAHSHLSGNDVIIKLDQNDQLVLSNVQLLGLQPLDAGDFLFV